jgi:hypothetical protein
VDAGIGGAEAEGLAGDAGEPAAVVGVRLEDVGARVTLFQEAAPESRPQPQGAREAPLVEPGARQARVEAAQDARALGRGQQVELGVGQGREEAVQGRGDHDQVPRPPHARHQDLLASCHLPPPSRLDEARGRV